MSGTTAAVHCIACGQPCSGTVYWIGSRGPLCEACNTVETMKPDHIVSIDGGDSVIADLRTRLDAMQSSMEAATAECTRVAVERNQFRTQLVAMQADRDPWQGECEDGLVSARLAAAEGLLDRVERKPITEEE